MDPAPALLERPPRAPALAPFVERLWHFEGALPPRLERVLPTGCAQLLVNLDADELRTYHGPDLTRVVRVGGAALAAVRLRALAIDSATQRRIVGVRFRAGGTRPFFREPADAFGGESVELDRVWGREGAVLRERLLGASSPARRLDLLEGVLLARAVRPLAPALPILRAAERLHAGARVAAVCDELGMAERRLRRLFRAEIGLAPKRFARVGRLQRAIRALAAHGPPAGGWPDFALRHGFYDQSHLIGEFRALAGMPPTRYLPRAYGDPNHVVVEG